MNYREGPDCIEPIYLKLLYIPRFLSVLLEPRFHVGSPLAAALHCANEAGIPWHDTSFWMGFPWKATRILVVPEPEPGSEVHSL